MKRALRHALRLGGGLLLGLTLLIAAALGWLVFTTEGARWLGDLAKDYEPRLSFTVADGALYRGLVLTDLAWQDESVQFTAERIEAWWSLGCLLRTRVCLESVRVERPRLTLPAAEEGAGPEPSTPIELPAIDLPVVIRIDALLLTDAELIRGEQRWGLDRLRFAGWLRDARLRIRELSVERPDAQVQAAGEIELRGDYPLDLKLQGRLVHPELPAPLKIDARLNDSVRALALQARLDGAVALTLSGRLQPLEPPLPFELRAEWETLGWPLATREQVLSRNGRLHAEGSLDGYRFTLATGLSGAQIPAGDWQLRAAGDRDGLVVEELLGQLLGGSLQADGRLRWTGGLRWQAALTLADIQPGQYWPDYPGRIEGRLRGQGELRDQDWSLTLPELDLKGELRGYPVAVTGGLGKAFGAAWKLQDLRVSSGPNRLNVAGSVGEDWALDGDFDLPELKALYPDIDGAARGRFRLDGPLKEPGVELSVSGQRLALPAQALQLAALELEGRIARLGFDPSRLTLAARGVQVQGQTLQRIDAKLDGRRAEHRLDLTVQGEDYGGELRLEGALGPKLNWQGRLPSARIEIPHQEWRLRTPAELAWNQAAAELSVQPHCWAHQSARLCLQRPASLGAAGQLALWLQDFELAWLQAYLPEGVSFDGDLNAEAEVGWRPGEPPRVTLAVHSRDGKAELAQPDAPALELPYQRLSLDGRLDGGSLNLTAELESGALGSGRLSLRTDPGAKPRPLTGEVDLTGLRLDLLRPFLPQIQTLAGALGVHGRIGGTLQEPAFFGRIELADGAVAAPALPMELSGLGITLDVKGDAAEIAGEFKSGEGAGTLSGNARWGGEDWQLALHVQGEELLFVYPPLARLQVSPDLTVQVQPRQVEVRGKVVVPRGEITIAGLPESAVTESKDVVVVRRPEQAPGEPPPEALPPGWDVSADIELVFGEHIEIEGMGLTGRIAGNLRVRQQPEGVAEAVGELRVEEGRYEAYGQNLSIRQGQLIFAGALTEPRLNVEAVREADDGTVAGVRVEGEPDAPQVSLFSEPTLPQEQILSYILRGRGLEGGEGATESQMLAQAALAVGVFGGESYAVELAEKLGVQDFAIGTSGEGQGTQFELSGYLSPKLFVSYGVGVFEPTDQLTLRYRLSRRFYVEAVRGLESALDVFYEFSF